MDASVPPPAAVTPAPTAEPSIEPLATTRPTVQVPTAEPSATIAPAAPTPPSPPELRLALAWPDRAIAAFVGALPRGTSGVQPVLLTRDPTAIAQIAGPAADAHLVSALNPRLLANGARLQPFNEPELDRRFHAGALASVNSNGQKLIMPLALQARPLVYRTDVLSAPSTLSQLRTTARQITRRNERFITFAGLDLAASVHDPQWLLFAGASCEPASGFSRSGVEEFRAFFREPASAFRRDHHGGDWRLPAIAIGRAAMAFADLFALKSNLAGSALFDQLSVAPLPGQLRALEGGGRLCVAIPASSGEMATAALERLNWARISRAVAKAAGMAPTAMEGLLGVAKSDRRMSYLTDLATPLFDWRLWPGKDAAAAAGLLNRALALGETPISDLLANFEIRHCPAIG